jgi:hypothetical protein
MNNMIRSTGGYAGLVFLIFPVFLCRNSLASIDSIVSENVKIEDNRISVQTQEITLGELLKAIERRNGSRTLCFS